MMGGKIRFAGIVFGCCLGTAVTGCSGHRMSVGSTWFTEGNHFSWLAFRSAKDVESSSLAGNAAQADKERSMDDDKPELLPWRSRLKGYRLGARLARGGEFAADRHLHNAAATSASNELQLEQPASVRAAFSVDLDEKEIPMPSVKTGELQLPVGVERLPERIRPDVAID